MEKVYSHAAMYVRDGNLAIGKAIIKLESSKDENPSLYSMMMEFEKLGLSLFSISKLKTGLFKDSRIPISPF